MPREHSRADDPLRDPAYLLDMHVAACAVREFVRGRTREEYESDLLLRSAVERQIEIIGEAARRVSRVFQDAHPEIPWRAIQTQRHRLAHEYGDINNDLIWTVAVLHVPALIGLLGPLIPPTPPTSAL